MKYIYITANFIKAHLNFFTVKKYYISGVPEYQNTAFAKRRLCFCQMLCFDSQGRHSIPSTSLLKSEILTDYKKMKTKNEHGQVIRLILSQVEYQVIFCRVIKTVTGVEVSPHL